MVHTCTTSTTNKRGIALHPTMLGGILVLACVVAALGFGKNKVQYENLKWKYHELPHFHSYFHQDQGELPTITAHWAEEAYAALAKDFGYKHRNPVPLLVFSSPTLFEQTNVILDVIPEGVGGFTEMFKNRIVIPFTGSYKDYRHVLHHELVHAFQFGILYDQFGGALLRNAAIRMPLWFAEGTAEYLSSGWDTEADMFMMDRVIHSSVPLPGPEMQGYMVYKGGQSFFHFLDATRGDSLFRAFLREFAETKNVEGSIKTVYNTDLKELGEQWLQELRRLYWPEIGVRDRPDRKAIAITSHTKTRSHFNLKPRISPNGKRVAFFSDAKDYTRILITDRDGEIETTIGQYGYGGYFESFQPFRSGLAWSPDGEKLAFITKSKGLNELRIVDVESKKLLRTFRPQLASMSSPDWSPDGETIVFAALKGHKANLYLYHLANGTLEQLTDDIMTESNPRFLRDGTSVVFAAQDTCGIADRTKINEHPSQDLYLLDISTKATTQLTSTPWNEREPAVSGDGKKLAFVSNENGIYNIYIAPLSNPEEARPLTNFIGGCYTPDWAREDSAMVFTLFHKQGWDVWTIDNPEEDLHDGPLEPTVWIKSQRDSTHTYFLPPSKLAKRKRDTTHVEDSDSSTIAKAETADSAGTEVTITEAEQSTEDTTNTASQESVRDSGSLAATVVEDSTETIEEPGDTARDQFAVADLPDILDSEPYRVKFSVDMVSLGMSINTFYGYSGQGAILLSDLLGNHRISLAGDVQGSFDEYYVYGAYLNSKFRLDFGVAGFFSRYYTYAGGLEFIPYHDTNLGLMLQLKYPFSVFSRIDFNLYYRNLNRIPYQIADNRLVRDDTKERTKINITLPALSYVFDNILWGITGPINGIRAQATLMVAPPLTPADESFASFDFDVRKYFHVSKRFVWANRIAAGASIPLNRDRSARRFFLGGSENWLFYRVNGESYEENLANSFYSDYIVPLRGWNYFDFDGTRFALFNTEFRFPFVREIDIAWPIPMQIRYINGAFFVDAGNAWDRGDQYESVPLPDNIFGGIGYGLRANLGIFILRYDHAWRTDWNTYLDRPTDYFSLGAEF